MDPSAAEFLPPPKDSPLTTPHDASITRCIHLTGSAKADSASQSRVASRMDPSAAEILLPPEDWCLSKPHDASTNGKRPPLPVAYIRWDLLKVESAPYPRVAA